MKIDFEFETKYGLYKDAIYISDYHTLSDQEIENMKQDRLSNWISIIESPPAVPEPDIVPNSEPNNEIYIEGEVYRRLTTAPEVGAKLVEVSGVWYVKA